jgi:hypothetical protein
VATGATDRKGAGDVLGRRTCVLDNSSERGIATAARVPGGDRSSVAAFKVVAKLYRDRDSARLDIIGRDWKAAPEPSHALSPG